MTANARCPDCGVDALRVESTKREVVADDGTQLQFDDELTVCSNCGERFYTYAQSMASSRARAGALRKHAGLLTPDEIRGFRERSGLTQAQLEAILRTGAKTLVRWEKGTVCQSRAADQLIRLLMVNPANLLALAGASGFDLLKADATPVTARMSFLAPAHFETSVLWGVGTNIAAQGVSTITIFDHTIVTRSVVVPGVAPRAEVTPVPPLATAA